MTDCRFLGEGAYGQVLDIGNGQAQKSFERLPSLVQEYVAMRYTKGWPNTLQTTGADFYHKTLNTELCDTSLRVYIEKHKEPSKKTKYAIFYDIIVALYRFHFYNIIHADLKPGNILMKEGHAYIGDLGFVSISKYAKVKYTARPYRDPYHKADHGHDLYSLGIVLAEILLWKRVDHKKITEEIKSLDKKEIDVILALMDANRENRPTVAALFKYLYNEEPPVLTPKEKFDPESVDIDHRWRKKLERYIVKTCEAFDIKRSRIGYHAILAYLDEHKISSTYYHLYVPCMLMILSSVFGKSGYTEKQVYYVCKRKGFTKDDVLDALTRLCNNRTFVNMLFLE